VTSDLNSSDFTVGGQVLDASPDAVVITDTDFRIQRTNKRASEILKLREEDLNGTAVDQLVPERFRYEFNALIDYRLRHPETDNASPPTELSVMRGDGTTFAAEVWANPLELNDQLLLLISFRDITRHKRVQNELQTNQLLLAEAQRVAQLGSWRWDIVSNQLTWSQQLYRLFGIEQTEETLHFSDFIDLIHPADRDRINSILEEAVESQSSFEMEYRIVRPDGVVRLIYGQGVAGLTDSGELISMIGTAQDVTERKANEAQAFQLALEQAARQEAERTKERFQFLAEVSEALASSLEYEATLEKLLRLIIPRQADWCTINTLGSEGKIDRVAVAHRNPEKQAVLEQIRERGFLPHGDDSHPLTRALQDAKPQLHTDVQPEMLERMARSEEHLDLSLKLNPTSVMLVPLIARGRAFGILTFGMSDSGRRYNEDDLSLAVEVAHRAAVSIDNAQLYREAQEAARAREEFVSLVSHELKTPLTVIKGYIQVLERYLGKPNWERDRIQTTRERLSTQVSRLELLVSDILDVSRMQRGRLDLKVNPETNLVELARHVLERFDDAIERMPTHELRLEANEQVIGCWDPLRLDQVFSNLYSNALKYSPDGGPINIRIWKDNENAYVDVEDRGVGISSVEQGTLFQPFQRGAAASRGISGTGLGLYITRQIIEQHGGSISVTSNPGESTTFHIQLPLIPEICATGSVGED
jgi:PAS domain S-box-containing protein